MAGTIVAACAVLHNVCLCSGEAEPEPQSGSDSSSDEDDDEEESADAARERRGLQSRRLYSQDKAVRDRLVLLPSTTHLQRVRDRQRRIRRRRQHR
uniref:Putative tick transposon n=1 Tax=Ixodes ricinus TaxID=34613 RepID=A0A6B0UD23_IXORI